MYDGPRVFFILLMWVGWIIVALGFFVWISGASTSRLAAPLGAYLIGGGVGVAAFSMIGKMIAGIGEELVAARIAAEKRAK
jgi:hypothetical protein